MRRTSISAAKNGLSALIDRVRHGESIIIEDRGVPVARIESVASPGQREVAGRAARLARQGALRPAIAPAPRRILSTAPPRPRDGARLSDAVIAERGETR
jgi:prevent-host-death family protein